MLQTTLSLLCIKLRSPTSTTSPRPDYQHDTPSHSLFAPTSRTPSLHRNILYLIRRKQSMSRSDLTNMASSLASTSTSQARSTLAYQVSSHQAVNKSCGGYYIRDCPSKLSLVCPGRIEVVYTLIIVIARLCVENLSISKHFEIRIVLSVDNIRLRELLNFFIALSKQLYYILQTHHPNLELKEHPRSLLIVCLDTHSKLLVSNRTIVASRLIFIRSNISELT